MAKSPSFLSRLAAGWQGFASAGYSGDAIDGTPRGARYGRRSALFEQERRHINSTVSSAGTTLRARCRYLSRENAYVANMKAVWTSYAVGTGWIPSLIHDDPKVVSGLHTTFKAWTDNCDLDGLTDFYGLQGMVSDEEFEAGEVFVRLLATNDGLKLQLMQSEQLPYTNVGASGTPAANVVRLGVEFEPNGSQRVAYHFYKQNPGDLTEQQFNSMELVRIPADEILHIFTPQFPGQLRGYPRMAGAIVPMFKLDEYEDALLERAATASKFAGFIKKTPPAETDYEPKPPSDMSDPGARQFNLETGVIYELGDYESWEQTTPPDPGSNYDDFLRRQVAKGCAAAGVPYAEVSGDLKSANFSSTRVGRQPFKRRCERWGNSVLVFQLCRPVWAMWLRLGLLAQKVQLPRGASRNVDNYSNLNWLGPKWEYVNPYQDAQADALLVDHGFKPRSRVIEESGHNADETDSIIKADQDRQDDLRLRLATTIPSGPAKSVTPGPTDPADPSASPDDGSDPEDPPSETPEPQAPPKAPAAPNPPKPSESPPTRKGRL